MPSLGWALGLAVAFALLATGVVQGPIQAFITGLLCCIVGMALEVILLN